MKRNNQKQQSKPDTPQGQRQSFKSYSIHNSKQNQNTTKPIVNQQQVNGNKEIQDQQTKIDDNIDFQQLDINPKQQKDVELIQQMKHEIKISVLQELKQQGKEIFNKEYMNQIDKLQQSQQEQINKSNKLILELEKITKSLDNQKNQLLNKEKQLALQYQKNGKQQFNQSEPKSEKLINNYSNLIEQLQKEFQLQLTQIQIEYQNNLEQIKGEVYSQQQSFENSCIHNLKQFEQEINRLDSINQQVQQIESKIQMLPRYQLLDDKIEQIMKQNYIQNDMIQQNIQRLDQTIQNEQFNVNIIKGQISSILQANQPNLQKSKIRIKQEVNTQQQINQTEQLTPIVNNHNTVVNDENTVVNDQDQISHNNNEIQLMQYQCYKCCMNIYENTVTLDCFHSFHENCIKELISQQLKNQEPLTCNCQQFIKLQTLQQLQDSTIVINQILEVQAHLLKNKINYSECSNCKFFWISSEQNSYSKCYECLDN